MGKAAVILALYVAACSSGEAADSTATSTPSPSTTATAAGPTITAPARVSTTTAPTTTTSTGDTTTTTELLEGEWADGPLVTTAFGALGWWDGDAWVDAVEDGALPVSGGEDYQVVVLDQLVRTTGGPPTNVCGPLDLVGVELDEPDLLGEFPGPYGLAISAPWTLQPHLFEELEDDGTYAGFAAELLADRGLEVAEPVIKQLFRTDLEGDGVDEVLVVAEEVTPGFIMEEGDYSIAFVRKVVDGDVQTMILGQTVVLEEAEQFSGAFSFGGVADFNGDGKMEVIHNGAYFESFSVSIWEYVNDDLGVVEVLGVGCGS
ncbi:MAG TPA: hypothetical protein VK969_09045 [Acidimicrobiia bacterium]|nr:hypothetical protein [Acidimicrobiia bacterium]